MNWMIWLSVVWIAPLLCFLNINEIKFKKNIAVGVTFPILGRVHEEVWAQLRSFKKEQIALCVLLVVLAAVGALLPNAELSMTLWGIWLDLALILPMASYIVCNLKLKRIKEAHGWKKQCEATMTVDLSAVPQLKWMSPWCFVPALLLALAPVVLNQDFWLGYLMDAACVVLFWVLYRFAYRKKAERVDSNTNLTKALTQVRQHNWGKMWLFSAYCMALVSWLMALSSVSTMASLCSLIAFTVLFCGGIMYVDLSTRRTQEKLTKDCGDDYVDEDDYWLGGIFYYNKNDSRLLINSRIGTNSSCNLAHPMGKVIMTFTLVLLLILPFLGVFMSGPKELPLSAEFGESGYTVTAGDKDYTIPQDAEITLLQELPPMVRVMGTGLPNYLSGQFSIGEVGAAKVSLDPTCPPFLLIESEDGIYLFGSRIEGQTQAVYEQLTEK